MFDLYLILANFSPEQKKTHASYEIFIYSMFIVLVLLLFFLLFSFDVCVFFIVSICCLSVSFVS